VGIPASGEIPSSVFHPWKEIEMKISALIRPACSRKEQGFPVAGKNHDHTDTLVVRDVDTSPPRIEVRG